MNPETGMPSLDRELSELHPRKFWPGAYAPNRLVGWWWNWTWYLEQKRERRRQRAVQELLALAEDLGDGSHEDYKARRAVRTVADAENLVLQLTRRNADRECYRRWL